MTEPLTIWYISKYVVPPSVARVGGRGFLILREMVALGHRCILFTSDSNHLADPEPVEGTERRETAQGVEVVWLRTLKYAGARSLRRVLSWIDFERRLLRMPSPGLPDPDVVIVSSLSLLSVLNGIRLKRRFGCRLVFEVRDIWPLVLYEEGGFSPRNPLVRVLGWVERLGYRRTDVIVGTMPNLGEHVAEVLGHPVPVHCIPQGVDEALLAGPQPLPEGYAETYLPEGAFTVCHAGTIGVTNALDTLLACARLMRDEPGIRFVVVGDGYMKARYQKETADLPNILFAPRVPRGAVQAVLARCDLLYFAVHPSKVLRYGQSLNKVIDYMLSGRPVVASYSGYPSMIDEAGSGSYVPAEDAEALRDEILRYARMPAQERERMGRRGREWLLENRRYPNLAERYLELIT